MAATFGATTRAIFTAVVIMFELTGDDQVILRLMGATVVAHVVFNTLSDLLEVRRSPARARRPATPGPAVRLLRALWTLHRVGHQHQGAVMGLVTKVG